MTAKVQGSFAAGFEPVKDALEKLLNSGCEDKVQLCVYVGKDCVIDLYGSFKQDDTNYNSDTIQVFVCLLNFQYSHLLNKNACSFLHLEKF